MIDYQAFQRFFSLPPLLDRWRCKVYYFCSAKATERQTAYSMLLTVAHVYNAIYPITVAKRRFFGKPGKRVKPKIIT